MTGQRRSEIAGMRWSCFQLDGDVAVLDIPAEFYKSGRTHAVLISSLALEIVRDLPKFKDGDHMLTTTHGRRPISGFSKAKKLLDANVLEILHKQAEERCDDQATMKALEPWRLHDLRRTCETGLAALQVGLEIRERVLGHALPGLQKTYNKYDYLNEKRDALEKWSGHLEALIRRSEDNMVDLRR